MRRLLIILIFLFLLSCDQDISDPITEPLTGITTILLENGLINCNYLDRPVVLLGTTEVTVSNVDTSIYFAMSESSPNDTIVILSHGVVDSKVETTGIPIADECIFIKGHFRNKDTSGVVYLYEDLIYYSFIDSIRIEPYRLISSSDTIYIQNGILRWKEDYRIDTLRFNVYFKPNLEIEYDRFTLSTINFLYKESLYDSLNYSAKFTVGLPSMNSEPEIILYPYSKIERVYENSILKVISRFNYQVEFKIFSLKL
jgi:hypothetical protein